MELYFKTRGEWRKWLEKNHSESKGIWLIYYKKISGSPGFLIMTLLKKLCALAGLMVRLKELTMIITYSGSLLEEGEADGQS